jgi:hypothetical protein
MLFLICFIRIESGQVGVLITVIETTTKKNIQEVKTKRRAVQKPWLTISQTWLGWRPMVLMYKKNGMTTQEQL